MDLLDLDGEALYFDEPLPADVKALIDESSDRYRTCSADDPQGDAVERVSVDAAEWPLLRAFLKAPEQLAVVVALYRFFYYRQRYPEALAMADRAIVLSCRRLALHEDWRKIDKTSLDAAAQRSMTATRFLLLALKGAAWLLLRQQQPEAALERLAPIIAFDREDRLRARDLQRWAEKALLRAQVEAAGDNVHLLGDRR